MIESIKNVNQRNLFVTDDTNQLIQLTYVLCHADKRRIGILYPINGFRFNNKSNDTDEISFTFHSVLDGKYNPLYDQIKDLKLVYIPEWKKYYQITVTEDETEEGAVKSITGTHLCEAELSQLTLNDIEINTEEDIKRDDYNVSYIWDDDNPGNSVLSRILKDKAPHYSIKYVSPSLKKLVRSFSISGTNINDFLRNTLSEELECIVEYDSEERNISLFDSLDYCPECHFRTNDVNIKYCPECEKENKKIKLVNDYGKYTNILISTENLAKSINVSTNEDEIKTCFRVLGGDDMINAAVRAINPSGSSYFYSFSNDTLEDMSPKLRDAMKSYDELYENLTYNINYPDEANVKSYSDLMKEQFDLLDELQNLRSLMMPETTVLEKSTAKEQYDIINTNLTEIAFNTDKPSETTVKTSILSVAKSLIIYPYKVDFVENSFELDSNFKYCKFKLIVVNSNKDDDIYESENLKTVTITNDYQKYLEEKIKLSLRNDECYDPFDEDSKYYKKWDLYALSFLKTFSSACQSCLDILIQQGANKGKDDSQKTEHEKILDSLYKKYHDEFLIYIEKEIKNREDQIDKLEKKLTELETLQKKVNDQLNFKDYLIQKGGDELFTEFCCYRRDDDYENSNYISDGLSNEELLKKAQDLVKVATSELRRACEIQYTISGSIANFMLMPEFKYIKEQLVFGNWIFIPLQNGTVYKLKLIGVSGDYTSLENIELTFSNAYKVRDTLFNLKDTIQKASSMASSYSYVARQASDGKDAKEELGLIKQSALNAAQYRIVNADNQNITIDEHGILGREWDELEETYSDKQIRIVNNMLCFTKDNWDTVSTALGELTYLNPEDFTTYVTDYGLAANSVISGLIVGGDIYSDAYYVDENDNNKKKAVTHFNLITGDFNIGGKSIVYDSENKELTFGNNVKLKWSSIEGTDKVLIQDDPDSNNYLTTITNNTIKTTNVVAENLQVKMANVEGELSANKIRTGIIGDDQFWKWYKNPSGETDSGSYINLADGVISFGNGSLIYDSSGMRLNSITANNLIIKSGSVQIETNYNDSDPSISNNSYIDLTGRYTDSSSNNWAISTIMSPLGYSVFDNYGNNTIMNHTSFIVKNGDIKTEMTFNQISSYLKNESKNEEFETILFPDGVMAHDHIKRTALILNANSIQGVYDYDNMGNPKTSMGISHVPVIDIQKQTRHDVHYYCDSLGVHYFDRPLIFMVKKNGERKYYKINLDYLTEVTNYFDSTEVQW